MLRNRLVPILLVAAALGCALPRASGPWQGWESAHDRDHPLTGRVIDVRERREISPAELLERLAAARFILLGERHDNPDHHRLQAWVIERLVAAGQSRCVAFEMLRADLQQAVATQRSLHPDDVDGIGRAVGWDESGWPAWPLYRPVFAAAAAARLPILAADLGRTELEALRAGRPPPEALLRLGLDRPLEPRLQAGLRADLEQAHCGALPEEALDRLVAIQRARDAQLAAALAAGATPDGAVLIAGAGHVGRDWGVPVYLERAAAADRSLSLALQEVDPTRREVSDYLIPRPPFDYLWMTPRVDDRDPCERFRDELRRMRTQGPSTDRQFLPLLFRENARNF